jgi:hypothetical protein
VGACKESIRENKSECNYHLITNKGEETAGMERIDRLYALLERDDIDEDTKAALRWAIFELEGK